MFKKSVEYGEFQDVQYVNGKVRFQRITLNVHAYTVDGVLIDTGAQSLAEQMLPFLKQADVDKVLLTHNHEDHTGGAHFMQQCGKPIYIHPDSVAAVGENADYPLYRKLFWGKRKPFEALPIGETFESRNAIWDVIATPGHTEDHLAFLNRKTGMLFTGDLFVSPKVRVILRNESIPTILRSIERVLTYDFEVVACQHAGIIENGRTALVEKQQNLYKLIDDVLRMKNKGMNVKEIQQHLFPKSYPIKHFSLGEWDTLHVVTSILNDPQLKG